MMNQGQELAKDDELGRQELRDELGQELAKDDELGLGTR